MNLRSLYLEHIKKTYIQGDKTNTILDDISFLFQKGMAYAITGCSGAGKSTLLHILAGLDQPTEGAVFFNEDNVAMLHPNKKEWHTNHSFGFMFQNPYLIAELSVLENVMLKGLIAGMKQTECKTVALDILQKMEIGDKVMSLPAELSGGQQQRVALARALIARPDFLCADEPTGNLDSATGLHIFDILKDYQQQWGMGIIISTHDTTIFQHMDVVLALKDGILTQNSPFSTTKNKEYAVSLT